MYLAGTMLGVADFDRPGITFGGGVKLRVPGAGGGVGGTGG